MSSSGDDSSDYSVNITESWRAQVGTEEGGDDVASDGVVLSNGDLVLAGSHGPAGSVPDSALGALRRGGSGDSSSSSSSSSNFVAYRLDGSTGQPVWQWEGTTGPTSGDFLFAAGLASGGTGGTGGTGGREEFVVLGGSTEGNWNNAPSSSSSSSSASSLGKPESSSSSVGVNGNAQIAAVKLAASTGEEIWRFQQVPEDVGVGGGTATGSVLGVAGDPDGNFFLVGFVVGRLTSASGSSSDRDFFVIKLDGATGGVIWRLQDGTPSEDDVFFAAATDSAGNIVAAGYTLGDYGGGAGSGNGGGHDYIAAKYSPDGEELWRYQSGSEREEAFRAVTVDGDDNVYLGGDGFQKTLGSEEEEEAASNSSPAVHKLDGETGQLIWTYDGQTSSTNTTLRSVVVDANTGLVVCAGATDGGWARQSRRFGQDDFALAFVESETGEEFGRWHGGSDADDALTFAGVAPDGSVSLAGYTRGNWGGNGVTSSSSSSSSLEGADFAIVTFPPLDRELIVPSRPTPAPSPNPTKFSDADLLLGPTLEPTRGGFQPTPGPSAASDAKGVGGSAEGGEGSGGDGWVVPVTVLGAIVGIFLLCGCCRCCFKWRHKEAKPAEKSAVPEGASAVPVPFLPGHSDGTTGIMVSSSPPPGHDGDLPWSGPTSLNAISVMHDVDLEGSNFVASPTSSTPPSFLPSGGGVRAAGTAGGAVPGDSPMAEEAAAAAAGVGFGEGAQRPRSGAGARSMYLGSDDTSGLVSPENYVQFPQPFSGFDVPVQPYAMGDGSKSRGGHGRNGSGGGGSHRVGGGGAGGNDGVGQMSARRAEPEIDVTDLVMDNNDYYTPDVATKSKSLEEAALVVAVAAASTKAGAGGGAVTGPGTAESGSGGENKVFRSSSSRRRSGHNPPAKGFVSLDSGGSGVSNNHHNGIQNHHNHHHDNDHHVNFNDNDLSVSEDKKLAAAAVAAAANVTAGADSIPSVSSSAFFDTDNIVGFAGNRGAAASIDSATFTDDGTSFEDQTNNNNNTRNSKVFMFNSKLPSVATLSEHEGGVARAPTEGGSRSGSNGGGGGGGGGGGNQRGSSSSRGREGSENYAGVGGVSRSSSSDIPPTPMSMPALMSMSFSTSMDGVVAGSGGGGEGGVQRGPSSSHCSSDDTTGLPPLSGRGGQGRQQQQQQRQQQPRHRLSSPRYSSEEDGLPPLSGGGGGSSVRFPFLSNASVGRGIPGGSGGSGGGGSGGGGGGGGRFLAPRPAPSFSSGDGSVRTASGYGSNASDGGPQVVLDPATGRWKVHDRRGSSDGGGGGGGGGNGVRGTPASKKNQQSVRANQEASMSSSSTGDAGRCDCGDVSSSSADDVVVFVGGGGVMRLSGDRETSAGSSGGGQGEEGEGRGRAPAMAEGARTVSSADTQTSIVGGVTLAEMAAPGWEKSSPANHTSSSGNAINGGSHGRNGNANDGGRRPGAASTLARTTDPADDAPPRECRVGDDGTFDPKRRVPLKIGAIGSGSRLSGSSGGLSSLLACVSGSAPGTPVAGGGAGVVVTRGGEERDSVGWWGGRAGGRGGSRGGGGSIRCSGGISGSDTHSTDLYAGPFFVCGDMQEALSPRGEGIVNGGDMGLMGSTENLNDGGGGGGLEIAKGVASAASVGVETGTE